jgi:ppGpp synthetase/RelA/SpoT-type nucleotidyltranferase
MGRARGMTDLETVEAYVSRHRSGYNHLVNEVREVCRIVQNQTSGLIYRVYSRSEKQSGGEELKDAAKILEKIDPPLNDKKLKDLHDIVGVTVVVYYSDSAPSVFDLIRKELARRSIKLLWGPENYNDGYYAYHSSFRSNKSPSSSLLCELQIKTVLHDAWSAKMHDLTYKPAGAMDERLGGLMSAVSSQIDGIETQSLTIRNIVNGRQRLESRSFQAYCDAFFGQLGQNILDTLSEERVPDDLWTKIDAIRTSATEGTMAMSSVQELIDEIDTVCSEPPMLKIGWLLMAKLASGFVVGDRARDLSVQVDRFLTYVEENPEDMSIANGLLWKVPGMFYVAGDLVRAAEYTERLAIGLLKDKLSDAESIEFEFNRLTYLLEFEHLKPHS